MAIASGTTLPSSATAVLGMDDVVSATGNSKHVALREGDCFEPAFANLTLLIIHAYFYDYYRIDFPFGADYLARFCGNCRRGVWRLLDECAEGIHQ